MRIAVFGDQITDWQGELAGAHSWTLGVSSSWTTTRCTMYQKPLHQLDLVTQACYIPATREAEAVGLQAQGLAELTK